MRGLQSRLNKLELVWNTAKAPRSVFRVIVSAIAKPLNWETSKCTRTLSANGSLLEVLILDGNCRDASEKEFDQFVARFPLTRTRKSLPIMNNNGRKH
jgi:hypothetical protein